MTAPALPGFSVSITNLTTGGQLLCSTNINVDYAQPASAAPSTVALTTDAAGASIAPGSQSVSNASGTVTFTITFPVGTTLSGKTVTASISNGGVVKQTDPKSGIAVNCPNPSPGGDGA